MDCELLKRCNESLVLENRKLHKELENQRALKMSYALTPVAMLTMCPSCENNPGISLEHQTQSDRRTS